MKIFTTLQIAIQALTKNKVRTVLTILGVVIGISSVTMIISAGDSFNDLIYGQIESFGANYINAEVRVPSASGGMSSQAQGVVITSMKEKDREDILKLDYVDRAYSAVTAQEIVSWQGETMKSLIYGVSADFIDIDATEVDQGRWFTEEEDDSLARVVVIGSDVKKRLFGNSNAIGENVKIHKMNYRVIGVAKPRGAVFFFNMDELVYIPLKTTQKLILGIDYVSAIVSQVDSLDREDQAVADIEQILASNHDIESRDKYDFQVMGSADAMDLMNTIIGGITLLLVALAAVSLVVGGVGIMNIMYATVAERTFEIGLRKSVGASKKSIMQQFLLEAVIITFLGGVVGIILGLIFIYLVYLVANYYGLDWPLAISMTGIILSICFSVVVGLIFGLYPAKKAADLNPITALRKE